MVRTAKTLAFLLAAVPVGAIALAVLLAGCVAVPILACTPLVVPALAAYRFAVGGVARIDATLANRLLGTDVHPPATSPGPRGYWRTAGNVLADGAFWRQQAYLFTRLSLGYAVALAEWTLLATSLGLITLPIWYRWGHPQLTDSWHVDTLGRAVLGLPVGIAGLSLSLALIRPLTAMYRGVVVSLLGRESNGAVAERTFTDRRRAFVIHASASLALVLFFVLIWAVTSRGYFWPEWPIIVLGLALSLHGWVELDDAHPEITRVGRATRGLAVQEGVTVVLSIFFTLIWAVTGAGYFWPVWPTAVLVLAVVIHAPSVYSGRGAQERIAVLEETRAGAVDHQETELERIERDLHDGAQARLVALGMSLGMAEQKLASDPDAAQRLLAEAREGTREALQELRQLARGIHPPVLADRGLAAAIAAIADRTPLRVDVSVDVPRRPPKPAESAAYFVVAEALANAGKHAHAAHVAIDVHEDGDDLVAEVVDDGAGGANPLGGGLRGLAQRVEALDGTLEVISPHGEGTTIRAVIPCGS